MLSEATIAGHRVVLFVEGLRVDARVGVHFHERDGAQPLIVDLQIELPMPGCDDISATLDYVHAAELVRLTAVSRHFALVESFAREVAHRLLANDGVLSVRIRVAKPSALAGSAAATGVELQLESPRPTS